MFIDATTGVDEKVVSLSKTSKIKMVVERFNPDIRFDLCGLIDEYLPSARDSFSLKNNEKPSFVLSFLFPSFLWKGNHSLKSNAN